MTRWGHERHWRVSFWDKVAQEHRSELVVCDSQEQAVEEAVRVAATAYGLIRADMGITKIEHLPGTHSRQLPDARWWTVLVEHAPTGGVFEYEVFRALQRFAEEDAINTACVVWSCTEQDIRVADVQSRAVGESDPFAELYEEESILDMDPVTGDDERESE